MTPAERLTALLEAIEAGTVTLISRTEPQDSLFVSYTCLGGGHGGTMLVLFNDCGEWDYIASVLYPDGTIDRDSGSGLGVDHRPSDPWKTYGIPGYLRHTREMWPGFTGTRSPEFAARLDREDRDLAALHPTLSGLVRAVRALPDSGDPTTDAAILDVLRRWHAVAAPTHHFDVVEIGFTIETIDGYRYRGPEKDDGIGGPGLLFHAFDRERPLLFPDLASAQARLAEIGRHPCNQLLFDPPRSADNQLLFDPPLYQIRRITAQNSAQEPSP